MADPSVLRIRPASAVRIDMSGWVQDWPWENVEITPTEVIITTALTPRRRVVFYPYEHRHEQTDGSWLFVGRENFTIGPGPAQAPSMDTYGPARGTFAA